MAASESALAAHVQGRAGEWGVCGLLLAVRAVRPRAGAAVIPAGGPGAYSHSLSTVRGDGGAAGVLAADCLRRLPAGPLRQGGGPGWSKSSDNYRPPMMIDNACVVP